MIKVNAYINGEFVDKKEWVEVISPIDNKPIGTYPALKEKDIDLAFESAKKSFDKWRKTDLNKRKELLLDFTKLVKNNITDLAKTMYLEIGKSIDDSEKEIKRTIDYINETIAAWEKINLKEVKIVNKVSYQYQVPLGVILAISPFNYPVNLSLSKIAPALISGNTVVFKAATNGSLIGGKIAELFAQSGFPKGVFNYVTGRGREIGDYLTMNPGYDMVSFTGSVNVGKVIAGHVKMKPYVLELGGNDAAYIRKDADLDLAVNEVAAGAFGFAGQRCTAIKRVIVDHEIASEFNSRLAAKVSFMKLDPVIDLNTANYIKELYDDAISKKSTIVLNPKFESNNISPAIVVVDTSTRVWNEEPFGPILPITISDSDSKAIDIMNNTNFGLQNSIFSSDIEWSKKASLYIESGTVNINAKSSRGPDSLPFLGVKESGFGVQGIEGALYSMTRVLNIVKN